MKTLLARVVIALIAMLIVVGGFSPSSTAKKQRLTTQTATSCSRIDNETLVSQVRAKISETPLLAGQHIQVQAEGGVITLRGNVGSVMKKKLAGRTAGRVKCVKRVVNYLVVTPPIGPETD